MCQITFVGEFDHYFAGGYGMWPALVSAGHAPLAYSVCKYMVSADHPVCSEDMLTDDDVRLHEHPLAEQYGVRAFLGVPLRDATDQPVGAITVLDTTARPWTATQLLRMVEIAEMIGPVSLAPDDAPLSVAALDTACLLDSMQEAFVAVNGNSLVVGLNRAAQELLGWSPEQVCGRPIEETMCPDYQGEPTGQALARMRFAPSGVRMRQRLRLRHQDGRLMAAQVSMSMVHGAAGTLLCAFIGEAGVDPA